MSAFQLFVLEVVLNRSQHELKREEGFLRVISVWA